MLRVTDRARYRQNSASSPSGAPTAQLLGSLAGSRLAARRAARAEGCCQRWAEAEAAGNRTP